MNGDSKHHTHSDGSGSRAFTAEQKAAVIRVRKCKNTDFYDILGLEEKKSVASDGEIKKAYRKLSLLTHPDKNGYTGADEAFKMVSRAFQVLSDPDKKTKFDRFGGDPDSRFQSSSAASGASPFSGFAQQRGAGRAGPMFEEEISPEELFRQFFGGGMGGGGFGGGPFGGFGGPGGFVFNVGGGGPGVRVHQFGGNNPRRRPHNHANANQQTSPFAAIQSLLPLLILFILPLLSSLFSGSSTAWPSVRFDNPLPPQTLHHTSNRLNVDYYVNPNEVTEFSTRKWKELDQHVEGRYVQHLSQECQWEQQQQQRAFRDAQGFFRRDEVKWDRAKRMEMPACRKLQGWGYSVQY